MSETVIERPPVPAWASAFATIESVGDPKSIFMYGTHGTRKTSIASSIYKVPGFNRVLHIDIDQGAETLATDPIIRAAIKDGSYNVLPINSLEANAKAKLEGVIRDVTTTDYGYDAVILDTVDVSQDVAEEVFEEKYATSGKGGKRDGFAVYREVGAWTDKYVRMLHASPYFVGIFTAHEKENTDEDTGFTKVQPRLSGSSKDAIGGIPSIVMRLQWQNHPETGERALIATLGEDEKLITKQRYRDLLPRQMRDITLPDLYARIRGEYTESAAPAATN